MPETKKYTPPCYSIALVSACALAYEILLLRLFSIIQWHHFAYMVISIAMLGYGASGAFLVFLQKHVEKKFSLIFLTNIALFSMTTVGCFLIAQQVRFSPEEILWDAGQLPRLLLLYLLLAIPFFFAANTVALGLIRYKKNISRIYAADLIGAAAGSLAIVALLFLVFPSTTLKLLATGGMLAVACAWLELKCAPRSLALLFALGSLFPFLFPEAWTQPAISPYKGLSQQLQVSGSRIISEHSSPLGLLTVIKSPVVPLRYAPGLSMNATGEPSPQLAVFTDGDGISVITDPGAGRETLSWLDQTPSALPYHLAAIEKALILGSGGGMDVLQALYHRAPSIDAVEMNRQMLDLVKNVYGDFAGNIYNRQEVDIHVAEARAFVSTTGKRYDLIQLGPLDAFSAASAGLYALSETYLYTVEALERYIDRLSAGGFVSLSRWIRMPPRDTLKLIATAAVALENTGVSDPHNQLILIRSWQTSTLLIKNGRVTAEEIAALKKFCRTRSFDLAYYPGIHGTEPNRYNILSEPFFYQGALSLVGNGRQDFLDRYKFNIAPATDERPYFFHFFKWRILPEILSLRGRGGIPLLEWGYLILIVTLLQAAAASVVLILLPLLFYRAGKKKQQSIHGKGKTLTYFFSIGLAFLFMEIACIQKFILFLHHPLYAVAVVLTGFLLFAGLGSAFSSHRILARQDRNPVALPITIIAFMGLLYIFFLSPVLNGLTGGPDILRISLTVILIAPLAFCMGMPFPLGITTLSDQTPGLVPWAWAVNGCASVISAVLATLTAIHFGFTVVILLALGFYAVALVSFPQTASGE